MSNRVEIQGQFNCEGLFSSWNRDEVVIDRQVALAPVPRNWTTFCTNADEALQAVTKAKSFHRIFGLASFVAFLVTYVILILRFTAFGSDEFKFSNRYITYLIILLLIPSVVTSLVTKSKVNSGMKDLEKVCHDRSGDGFRYALCNQQWSGCSNGGTKKYFVTLMVTDAELAASASINITSTSSVPVAIPVSWSSGNASGNTTAAYNPQPKTSAPATSPGTSIFDQLRT
mmetsp:Transcript_5399/g.8269  ORF Transcript_5399/g.8269 Transcript_5399/m.8269 type:complete len:229 (-) Transcript_5399:228-914(-)